MAAQGMASTMGQRHALYNVHGKRRWNEGTDIGARKKRMHTADLQIGCSTWTLPELGVIRCLTVGLDGTLFAGTNTAIYLISAGDFITLFAGSQTETGYRDGRGTDARFNGPHGLVVDFDGSVLVCDTFNHCVRRVSQNGTVTTLAGSQKAGYIDGVGADACFTCPWGIVADKYGTIYVCDWGNNCIRKVTRADGVVSTLCGQVIGFVDGQCEYARFYGPTGLALDTEGSLIVADNGNHCIRKVTLPDGYVTTVAGGKAGGDAGLGFADGEGSMALFNCPNAVAVDGNNSIVVADQSNHRVRMIVDNGATTGDYYENKKQGIGRYTVTTLAGSSMKGKVDGPGAMTRFNEPWMLAMDEKGHVLVADLYNESCVRILEASLAPPLCMAVVYCHNTST
jgi:hypothetical protein